MRNFQFIQKEFMIVKTNKQDNIENDSGILIILLARQFIKRCAPKNLTDDTSTKEFFKKYLPFKKRRSIH